MTHFDKEHSYVSLDSHASETVRITARTDGQTSRMCPSPGQRAPSQADRETDVATVGRTHFALRLKHESSRGKCSDGERGYFRDVRDGGAFIVTGNQAQLGNSSLIVQGNAGTATQNGSVYLTGSNSTVQLAQEAVLECDNNYYQDNGTLETTDSTICKLQVGAGSAGTATIAGGEVWIDTLQNDYGELDVNGNLNFDAGQLNVSIQGYAPTGGPGTSDKLKVTGTLDLNPDTNTLYVYNYGTLQKTQTATDFWVVIQSSINISGDFLSESSSPQANLAYGPPNVPEAGKYRIKFNG